jgi:hypothetical protein
MDDLTQLLLSHVAGGPGGAVSLPDIVAQSLGDDPLAAPLAEALRKREAAAEQVDDIDEPEVLDPDPEVADVLQRLYAELETLRERTRVLADALGACPRCFGEDHLCQVCRGRGRAGGRQPDDGLFQELVAPACRRQAASIAVDPRLPVDAEMPTS